MARFVFRVGATPADETGDTYWVLASTTLEARRLIARNVPTAAGAQNEQRFSCLFDDTKAPPEGVIYSRLHEPVTISRR
jgi:hypothetical protein